MAEFEVENKALVPQPNPANGIDDSTKQDRFDDLRNQAQAYGQQAIEGLNRAKDYAAQYGQQAVDKIKELQNKDFSQIAEDAKDFARRKPVEAVAITAAVGLIVGLIIGRGRR
jgi:ElaB/YqjD/DUF883 family membrane-anchored ribosome-binding protein